MSLYGIFLCLVKTQNFFKKMLNCLFVQLTIADSASVLRLRPNDIKWVHVSLCLYSLDTGLTTLYRAFLWGKVVLSGESCLGVVNSQCFTVKPQ